MAGHSHASNIKHKKERKDLIRGKNFLELRKKIENIIKKESSYEKAFSLARQNNFPKEKVKSIIAKMNNDLEDSDFFYFQNFYKHPCNAFFCLEGFIKKSNEKEIEKITQDFKLEKIKNENTFKYFNYLYFIRLKADYNLENLIFSSFSSHIIDKINKISEIENSILNFEVVFLEELVRDEALEFLKNSFKIVDFEVGKLLYSFSSMNLKSNEFTDLFLLFKKRIFEIEKDLKIFTSISNEMK